MVPEVLFSGPYRRMWVGAEDGVLPDDAVDLQGGQPGHEDHRVGRCSGLHAGRGSRNWEEQGD